MDIGLIMFLLFLGMILVVTFLAIINRKKSTNADTVKSKEDRIKHKNHFSASSNKYKASGRFLHVGDDYFGFYSVSDNDRYIISWYTEGSKSIRTTPYGKLCFIDKNDNSIKFVKDTVFRPKKGKVINNGISIITDQGRGGQTNYLYCFDKEGNIIFDYTIYANICSSDISESGRYVAVYSLGGKEGGNDGYKVFFFNLESKKLMWEQFFKPWKSKKIECYIDDDKQAVVIKGDENSFNFSFDGTFLDKSKYDTGNSSSENGYELLEIVDKRILNLTDNDYTFENINSTIELINKAVKLDISDNTKAKAMKTLGEIYTKFDKTNEAIDAYEKALNFNPKIGVKRKLSVIKQNV